MGSQVQLLVSDSDVESYKQIKADLDGLRLLVEKSELWVYKAKNGAKMASGLNDSNGTSNGDMNINKSNEDDADGDMEEYGGGGGCGGGVNGQSAILDNNNIHPHKKPAPMLSSSEKQGSAIDLDIGPPLDDSQAANYKTIQQILIRMNRLCVQLISTSAGGGSTSTGGSANTKPRKHEQRLLRNMGVHTVVLDLLQIPYDKKEDVRMNELMRLAHEFLQNFCRGNQPNQALLHKHLELFLTHGVSCKKILRILSFFLPLLISNNKFLFVVLFFQLLETQTVCAIFQDNAQLCSELDDKVVQHFVHCIETRGRHVEYMQFLQTIVKAEGQFIRKCQDLVMQEVAVFIYLFNCYV